MSARTRKRIFERLAEYERFRALTQLPRSTLERRPELAVWRERAERQGLTGTIAVEAPADLLRVGLSDHPSALDALDQDLSLSHGPRIATTCT